MKQLVLIFFFHVLTVSVCSGQDQQKDLDQLIRIQADPGGDVHDHAHEKGKFQPVVWVMNAALTIYQTFFSRQLSTQCIYELSCSRFSREAIRQFGPIKGVFLTGDRLTRCNGIHYNETSRLRRNKEGKIIDVPEHYVLRKP